MIIEDIHIKGCVALDDTLMLTKDRLSEIIREAIEHGKEIAKAERVDDETVIKGKELARFLRIGYSTLRKKRKEDDSLFQKGTALAMTLKNATQFRNQILKIN